MSQNKRAYFQGGGGVNEPTPGKKKYPVEKAILVQPRFKEPFYRNYDLYDTEGVNGPAVHGPGSGWNHMDEHESVKEFLEFRRKRLNGKYVADDMYIEDTPANYKERVKRMEIRAKLFSQIIKTAGDENDGPNFDYGKGLYSNMDKYKSVKDFEDHADKGPGAFFAVDHKNKKPDESAVKDDGKPNFDLGSGFYENLEKYDSVDDFIQHSPLGYKYPAKIKPEKERAKDVNHIDFPIDEQVNRQDQMIYPEEDQYQIRREKGDRYSFPSDGSNPGPENLNISMTSPQIAGEHSYLPDPDFEGRSDDALNFGHDYTEDEFPASLSDSDLENLSNKYLSPAETDLFGLPDGIDPISDLDPEATESDEDPFTGTSDMGEQMYDDKWNI